MIDVRGDRVRTYYCSCGERVRGNGAKASHRRKHYRRGDKHQYLGSDGHKYPETSDAAWRKLMELLLAKDGG